MSRPRAAARAAVRSVPGARRIAGKKRAGWSHHSPPNGGSSVVRRSLSRRNPCRAVHLQEKAIPGQSSLNLQAPGGLSLANGTVEQISDPLRGNPFALPPIAMEMKQTPCQLLARQERIVLFVLRAVAEVERRMHTQDTIRTLNRLIATCRDTEAFCAMCADGVVEPAFRTLLAYRRDEWGRQGDELQALVLLMGGEPRTNGRWQARAARVTFGLRLAALGANDAAVLAAWQRAQQAAIDAYEEALSGYLPERIRRTLGLHADRLADRHEQIVRLRGRFAIQSEQIRGV